MTEEVEYIDETEVPVEKEQKKITLMDMLQYELRSRMTTALEFKTKIDTAKTSYKKKYYQKKLQKNNTEAAKILTAIENMNIEKAQVYENPPEPIKE